MIRSVRTRRITAGLMVSLLNLQLLGVNAAFAADRRVRFETLAEDAGPLDLPFRAGSPYLEAEPEDAAGFEIYPDQGPRAAGTSDFGQGPRAPGDSEEPPPPRKGLWSRIKSFMAEDWRQTKQDMQAVGEWLKKPLSNFKIGWRKLREKVRTFRVKLMRGTKLFAASLVGRELQEEEEMVHLLLTAYIDQNGVEKLLEVMDNSDDSQLEQVALLARKVEDPVLRSQLLQRYVAREYLRMRKQAGNENPETMRMALEKVEETAATMEVSDPDPVKWQKPDEVAAAPVYQPYYPFVPSKEQGGKRKISLQKVLIGLIAGAGLILAGYFAFTTMTIAPFLAFMSSVVSLLALTQNLNFGQRVIVVQQPPTPFGGPYPQQPPTEEPPPLQTPPPELPPMPTAPPLPDPDPMPDPNPAPGANPDPVPEPQSRRINVNQASADDLQDLPGIGPELARRLVATRKKSAFRDDQDLLKVVGIGKKKLAALRPHLAF